MKTYKNIWATLFIAMVWGGYLVGYETTQFWSNRGFILLFGLLIALAVTFQTLRTLQYIPDMLEKQQPLRRTTRGNHDLLNQLDDQQLEVLRQRLADLDEQEYESLEYLLAESGSKRKNR